MVDLLHSTARSLVDGFVSVESALLERRPASLEDVGRPIVVTTHRRSGTHLTLDTLRRNFPACRPRMLPLENLHYSYLVIDRFERGHHLPLTEREALRILAKAERPMIKTHAEVGFPDIPGEHRAFVDDVLARSEALYIARDGRKVMCSLWVWRSGFEEASRVPFGEFIRQTDAAGRTRARQWADHVLGWLAHPGVVWYTFDQLVKDSARVLNEIGERYGMTPELADPIIPPAVRTRGESWMARLRGDLTSTNHHAGGRRPPTPDEVFSPDDLAFFEREAGEAQERLGYAAR